MHTRIPSLTIAALGVALIIPGAPAQDNKAGVDEWIASTRAAKKKNPVAADDLSLARGKALYVKECASCHGDKGKGDGPGAKDLEKKPGDLSVPKLWKQSDGALFWKLTEGRKPMPSYLQTMTEDDRWHIINYLRTLAPKQSE